jgi:uncharacterized membrane protein YdjX (TVP38/TMEM64 family)
METVMASSGSASRRPRWVLPVMAAGVLAAALFLLPVSAWLDASIDWVNSLGWWGPLALVGIYIVACVLLVPGSVITLAAGAAFGVVKGSLAVSVGATLGAVAAFLVGRYLARDWVAAKIEGNPRFAAVDEAVGREGFKIVLLTRLSPAFPFAFLNYAYGLTRVSLKDYALGSWLGMIPGTILYVYAGHAAKASLGAAAEGRSSGEWALLGFGLLATVVVTLFVTRIARKALAAEVSS